MSEKITNEYVHRLIAQSAKDFFDNLPGATYRGSKYRGFDSNIYSDNVNMHGWKAFRGLSICGEKFKLGVERCLRYTYKIPYKSDYSKEYLTLVSTHNFSNEDLTNPIRNIIFDLTALAEGSENLKIIETVMEDRIPDGFDIRSIYPDGKIRR